jgi:hypothetical protein
LQTASEFEREGMKRLGLSAALAASLFGCKVGGSSYLFGTLPRSTDTSNLGGIIQVTGPACTTTYKPSASGHVVWTSETYGHVYRMEAEPGASPEDVSYELDKLGTGTDSGINISPDGQWLIAATSRFGCGDTNCLVLISQNVCMAEVIIDSGTGLPINSDEWSAVGVLPNGDIVVVYPGGNGPHPIDLFAITRHDGAWGTSTLLTASDPYPYNAYPSLSKDSTKLLFDCGTNSYSGGNGTAMCQVNTDGTDFSVLHTPSDGPAGDGEWPLHKGNYTPSGAIVFEGEWNQGVEIIWEYAEGSSVPEMVNKDTSYGIPAYTDDNTPCVLPDGRIASLWLPNANHELKIMNADGTNGIVLEANVDVVDVGQSCSR